MRSATSNAFLPNPQSDLARESPKDPYRFDFLGLTVDAQKREIENALVQHVPRESFDPDREPGFQLPVRGVF